MKFMEVNTEGDSSQNCVCFFPSLEINMVITEIELIQNNTSLLKIGEKKIIKKTPAVTFLVKKYFGKIHDY